MGERMEAHIVDPRESRNYDNEGIPALAATIVPLAAFGANLNRIFVTMTLLTADNTAVPVFASVGYMRSGTYQPLASVCQGQRTVLLSLEQYGPCLKFPIFVSSSIDGVSVALTATTLVHRGE